jgi:hypothetical protein
MTGNIYWLEITVYAGMTLLFDYHLILVKLLVYLKYKRATAFAVTVCPKEILNTEPPLTEMNPKCWTLCYSEKQEGFCYE